MKIYNKSIKGALVAASLATVLGGWTFLGIGDRRQASANSAVVDYPPEPVPGGEQSVNHVPLVETVPGAALFNGSSGDDLETPPVDLAPIPEVFKRFQQVDSGRRTLRQLPSLPGSTEDTSHPVNGSAGQISHQLEDMSTKSISSPSDSSAVGDVDRESRASLPTLDPLPPLPDMPDLGPLPALQLPSLDAGAMTSHQPNPVIRTRSSR